MQNDIKMEDYVCTTPRSFLYTQWTKWYRSLVNWLADRCTEKENIPRSALGAFLN